MSIGYAQLSPRQLTEWTATKWPAICYTSGGTARRTVLPAIQERRAIVNMQSTSHTRPGYAKTNGIELCYETFGNASAEPLLLIMGLGAQMTLWDDDFCTGLAARGFYVIRFDNRDAGLSTRVDVAGTPDLAAALLAVAH